MFPQHLTITLLALALALGAGGAPPDNEQTDTPPSPPSRTPWKVFAFSDLQVQRDAQNQTYMRFLSENSFSMGIYHLPAGGEDTQSPHAPDEIYYVMTGTAKLSIDGVDHDVEPGSAFFVKAQVSHRFHSITSDLNVLVVFRKSSGATGPDSEAYSMSDMVATRNSSANEWNKFLVVPTMSLGMYMLPESVGGDEVLTHTFDEINIVVNGSSRFSMGEDVIDIEPGSIVYVGSGIGHRFTNLSSDLDVLILWAR